MSSVLIRPSGSSKAGISSAQQPLCQICQQNESRYTCPRCNLHYCSLQCFRDPQHSACVDSFAQSTLQQDLAIDRNSKAPKAERERMMQLLHKLEQQELEESELDDQLADVNLDDMEEQDMLKMLTPEQRKAFQDMLKDPAKVDSFLAETLENETPWWLLDEPDQDDNDANDSDEEELALLKPVMMDRASLPSLKRRADGNVQVNPDLVYNLVAILLAYAHCIRTLDLPSFRSLPPTSSERAVVQAELGELVPFLREKSTLVLKDVGSAIEYVSSRTKERVVSPHLWAILLADVAALLEPVPVTELREDDLSSHPAKLCLLALSDLHGVFAHGQNDSEAKPRQSLIKRPSAAPKAPKTSESIARKVLFYASVLASDASPLGTDRLKAVVATLVNESRRYIAQAESIDQASSRPKHKATTDAVEKPTQKPRIQELP